MCRYVIALLLLCSSINAQKPRGIEQMLREFGDVSRTSSKGDSSELAELIDSVRVHFVSLDAHQKRAVLESIRGRKGGARARRLYIRMYKDCLDSLNVADNSHVNNRFFRAHVALVIGGLASTDSAKTDSAVSLWLSANNAYGKKIGSIVKVRLGDRRYLNSILSSLKDEELYFVRIEALDAIMKTLMKVKLTQKQYIKIYKAVRKLTSDDYYQISIGRNGSGRYYPVREKAKSCLAAVSSFIKNRKSLVNE